MIKIRLRPLTRPTDRKTDVEAAPDATDSPAVLPDLPEAENLDLPVDRTLRVHVEGSDTTPLQAWAIYQGPGTFLLLRSRQDYPTSEEAYRAGYAAAQDIARRLKTEVLKHSAEFDEEVCHDKERRTPLEKRA